MAASLEDQLIKKVRSLPPDKQRETLTMLEHLTDKGADSRAEAVVPVWKVGAEVNDQLAEDTWDNIPTDGSINLSHYLYGPQKLFTNKHE